MNFERPVDTSSKNISYQNKTTYVFKDQNLSFSNQFNGARLNGVKQLNDSRLFFGKISLNKTEAETAG